MTKTWQWSWLLGILSPQKIVHEHWTPLKIRFFSPYEGSSLENPNYYWPRRKMMMSLHSSSFVSTLNGYHHAIVHKGQKHKKTSLRFNLWATKVMFHFRANYRTTTDARCILTQFFPCIPNFFASIGLVNSIFCTTASVAQQWNNWIFSGKISIRIGKIQMIHSCVVDLRTLWELLF